MKTKKKEKASGIKEENESDELDILDEMFFKIL